MNRSVFLFPLAAGVMGSLDAESLHNPYDKVPTVPLFSVASTDIKNEERLGLEQMSGAFGVEGGKDLSPELTWSGSPKGTKSYAVSMFDADAPTPSGFWHWMVVNIPATITKLDSGAGKPDGKSLPKGSWQIPNDARMAQYVGAAPPKGQGKHRYFLVVTALDVEALDVPRDTTPAFANFSMLGHILGRAMLVVTAEQK